MNEMFNSWDSFLAEEMKKPYFIELETSVRRERRAHAVYPAADDVFHAFRLTPLHETRVLILGQDPYHGPGQAHGLSFSVPQGVPLPPSLRNIMKERHDDIGLPMPQHGDLTPWAQQGVLLLNSTLTVRHSEAGSHQELGWERFTDQSISVLNEKKERVVFVLWGAYAQRKKVFITAPHHIILTAPHPSPLSAHRGFFGSRPFSHINTALRESGSPVINWSNE